MMAEIYVIYASLIDDMAEVSSHYGEIFYNK
jgi:hypothetical protein